MIKIEGSHFALPTVEGSSDVYSASSLVLAKPRWVADSEVTNCGLCDAKFTQLRRKHHCRQCGKVLCSKCCSEKSKSPLTHLGVTESQRVCEYCRPTAELMNKCFSSVEAYRLDAVQNLVNCTKETNGLIKVLEVGGMQVLIHLARINDSHLRCVVLSGLHQLSTHPILHSALAECGVIKAISRALMECDDSAQNLLTEGISALTLLAHSQNLKTQFLADGALEPLLRLCSCQSEPLVLMSLSVVCLLVDDPGTHEGILTSGNSTLPKIVSLATHRDQQIQEVSLRCLCLMSLGNDNVKQRILQEDIYAGHQLLRTLSDSQPSPRNPQVLTNAACLIANLAASPATLASLKDLIIPLCSLMGVYSHQQSMMLHVARGLANFASMSHNAQNLIPYIPQVVSVFLKSSSSKLQLQGLRLIISLLQDATKPTLNSLIRDGVGDVLGIIGGNSQIVASIQDAILREVPQQTKPS